jgi:hypothetical protein
MFRSGVPFPRFPKLTILLNHQMEISLGYLEDIKPVKRYLDHKSIMEKMIHSGMGTK